MSAPEHTVAGANVPLTVVTLGVHASPSDAVAATTNNNPHILLVKTQNFVVNYFRINNNSLLGTNTK